MLGRFLGVLYDTFRKFFTPLIVGKLAIYLNFVFSRSTDSVVCNPVFHTSGLMRSRLTPDTEKLIITTTEGYIIVIHDLDLTTLSQDLAGFKPSLYRVMQTRGFPLHQAYRYNSLFTRKRNRVELISDFPSGNDAEMIASLDVGVSPVLNFSILIWNFR